MENHVFNSVHAHISLTKNELARASRGQKWTCVLIACADGGLMTARLSDFADQSWPHVPEYGPESSYTQFMF